jgi:hypothetical protein
MPESVPPTNAKEDVEEDQPYDDVVTNLLSGKGIPISPFLKPNAGLIQ